MDSVSLTNLVHILRTSRFRAVRRLRVSETFAPSATRPNFFRISVQQSVVSCSRLRRRRETNPCRRRRHREARNKQIEADSASEASRRSSPHLLRLYALQYQSNLGSRYTVSYSVDFELTEITEARSSAPKATL